MGSALSAKKAIQRPATSVSVAATKRSLASQRIVALDQLAHPCCERPRDVNAFVHLAHGPDVDEAVGEEDLLGREHVGPAQVALLAVHALVPQELAHALALGAY